MTLTHHNRLLNGPKFFDNHGRPAAIKYSIEVTVLQDDVMTMAVLQNKSGQHLSSGYARRHPRDARNPELGHDLAVARAFARLADRYGNKAEHAMTPDPDPMREALKAMKRANRAEQRKRKNAKRREARERYLRDEARCDNIDLTDIEVRDSLGRAFGDWS